MAPALLSGSLPVTCSDQDRRRSSRLSPRWPQRPLGLSSRRLVQLLDVRDETHERNAAAADSIGYMARLLIQTTLPHRNPGTVPVWTRTNGNFTLQITPGYSIATPTRPPRPLGVPFGVYPRLVFTYLTSEAVRTRSPEVFLGRSFAEFIRRLGLDVRGGERGTIGRLKDQLARLTRATIDWSYVEGNTELSEGIRPIEGSYTFWDAARPSSEAVWPSSISLNARLFDELVRAPVPIDMRVVRQLSQLRSPMAYWLPRCRLPWVLSAQVRGPSSGVWPRWSLIRTMPDHGALSLGTMSAIGKSSLATNSPCAWRAVGVRFRGDVATWRNTRRRRSRG